MKFYHWDELDYSDEKALTPHLEDASKAHGGPLVCIWPAGTTPNLDTTLMDRLESCHDRFIKVDLFDKTLLTWYDVVGITL